MQQPNLLDTLVDTVSWRLQMLSAKVPEGTTSAYEKVPILPDVEKRDAVVRAFQVRLPSLTWSSSQVLNHGRM